MSITKKDRESILTKLRPALLSITQLTTWVLKESGYFEEEANRQLKKTKKGALKWKNQRRSAS